MSERPEAELRVTSSPGVEIEIYDHQFRSVARATESWSETLPVGLYKVQFRAGGVAMNELVALEAKGAALHRELDGWRSAAPAARRPGASEQTPRVDVQMHAGMDLWAETSRRALTSGSRRAAFCFVSSPYVQSRTDLGRNLRLGGFETTAAPREVAIETGSEEGGWATKSLLDPPQFLRLRFFDGLREVEQLVPTLDGYCTAVFLRHGRTTSRRWGVSGSATTILMARLTDPASEHQENHRYADLALRALERGGRPVSDGRAEALCTDTALDPLTRLYVAAHLISRWHFSPEGSRPEWALHFACQALDLLSVEAPELPDVRLLARWAQARGGGLSSPPPPDPVTHPPLLNFSWSVGIQAAIDDPSLVAADSLAISASLQRTSAGPWFAWRASPPLRPPIGMRPFTAKEELVGDIARDILPASAPGSQLSAALEALTREGLGTGPLTSFEAAIAHALVNSVKSSQQLKGKPEIYAADASPAEVALRRVSASFGLTANTVASVMESTVRKLIV